MGIGENLKRYRLINELSLAEVGKRLSISPTAVAKYEKEIIIPDSKRLIEFSKMYKIPVYNLIKSYMMPTMKLDTFRKKSRLVGKKLEVLQSIIQIDVSKYIEVLQLSGIKPNYKLEKIECNSIEDAENVAYNFRKKYLSPLLPIQNLTNILENLGIYLISIRNQNGMFNGFDGISEKIGDIPFIVSLDIEDGARQRFTIAHELGHLLISVKGNQEESICHRFASALLLPKEAMINEFGSKRHHINFTELEIIKNEYGVSNQAIIYRLRDLKIINESTYRNLCMLINKQITKSNQQIFPKEITHQYERIVLKLQSQEIISAKKAAEYLEITIDEYYQRNNNS